MGLGSIQAAQSAASLINTVAFPSGRGPLSLSSNSLAGILTGNTTGRVNDGTLASFTILAPNLVTVTASIVDVSNPIVTQNQSNAAFNRSILEAASSGARLDIEV